MPKFIYNHGILLQDKLILKHRFRAMDYEFSCHFVIDTGFDKFMLLSKLCFLVLQTKGRIKQDELDVTYIEIDNKKIPVLQNNSLEMFNVIGLPFLRLFDCNINISSQKTYSITNIPNIF